MGGEQRGGTSGTAFEDRIDRASDIAFGNILELDPATAVNFIAEAGRGSVRPGFADGRIAPLPGLSRNDCSALTFLHNQPTRLPLVHAVAQSPRLSPHPVNSPP